MCDGGFSRAGRSVAECKCVWMVCMGQLCSACVCVCVCNGLGGGRGQLVGGVYLGGSVWVYWGECVGGEVCMCKCWCVWCVMVCARGVCMDL